MKNILSYIPNTPFNGKEIKDWITYHINNKTEYFRIARKMGKRYSNLIDNKLYIISPKPPGTGGKERKKYTPSVIDYTKI